jgi:hypothetical protein
MNFFSFVREEKDDELIDDPSYNEFPDYEESYVPTILLILFIIIVIFLIYSFV